MIAKTRTPISYWIYLFESTQFCEQPVLGNTCNQYANKHNQLWGVYIAVLILAWDNKIIFRKSEIFPSMKPQRETYMQKTFQNFDDHRKHVLIPTAVSVWIEIIYYSNQNECSYLWSSSRMNIKGPLNSYRIQWIEIAPFHWLYIYRNHFWWSSTRLRKIEICCTMYYSVTVFSLEFTFQNPYLLMPVCPDERSNC